MAMWLVSLSTATLSTRSPSASLTFLTGTKATTSTLRLTTSPNRSGLLHCSFVPSSTSLSFPSTFSGTSIGITFSSNNGVTRKRSGGLLVRAGKAALCLTKRNRSRKSLARTHGFRRRMRTTGGRAILKRRRAKGRKILCTKSYPSSGVMS
ncbi:60S ribosomal protein L34 [Ranunculus cassubicifolius]